MSEKTLEKLRTRLAEIHNLGQAGAVLGWDQRTYMPPKGSEARARQLSTIAKLSHEMFVAEETRNLLWAAEGDAGDWSADSNERAMLRVTRRDFDKATKVPTALVAAMAQTCALAEDVWQKARADDDFAMFAPWLEKILDLKRQYAAAVAPGKGIYDALLDDFEEGMTAAELDPLFTTLKAHGVPLVAAIKERGKPNSDELLTRGV